ncbi:uncharacterized protein LOC124920621 isoform X2 [Impatiens glandulifera]|uniref:uncharacterized protein LOC124920621 isoform X2 n=1 Tax=Impatiens glandulifera TaxID=253017 RepID=UPI001FB14DA7|nr:uncharacterized protein LOC124920621 isoform X2 [Impatiens glandulifera]
MGENDLQPLTDLELALGASNQRIRTGSRIESGAGVNAAASRLNMTFVASDPLSEIVWSPHKGLSLKYTDSRFSDQRPHNFWDVGPSNMILSPSQRNSQRNSPSRTTYMNPIIEENITISQTREQTRFAKSHGGSTSMNPATDPSCSPQCGREYGREVGLKLCSTSEPRQELLSNSTSLSGKDKANPENSTPMVNQEFTAESGLWTLKDKIDSGKKELSPPDTRNKGKEKALSVGDFNDRMLQDENDSHDSVESCNSAGLLSKGKKKWIFEHQDIVESKRAKRDIHESPASSSFPRQDSSFMNWISNVVKGLSKSDEADALPPALPLSLVNTDTRIGNYDQQIIVSTKDLPESRIAGFQTMFQSIYCANPKDNKKGESNGEEEADRSKELVQVDNSHKSSSLLKRKFTESTSEVGEAPFNSEKANINMISGIAHKSEPLANLWITRFSHKAANVLTPKLDHQGQRAEKELECPPDQMKPIIGPPVDQLKLEQVVDNLGDDDDKFVHHFSNAPSSPKVNSEAIASIFARRLVAIKHFIPLDAEKEESAVEINSNNNTGKQPIVDSPVLINPTLDWKISSEKRESSSDERQKLVSCSGDDVLEPLRKHANVPIGVFEFIKKLRLTRMDILKWINSGKSLSKLNGYFMRVRLGKKEGEVVGGTSYQVACISGEQKECVEEGSKVSISVVVVGGVRCSVESQYISNKGFLEDELMVWWFSTVKSKNILIAKDKLQIKLEERERLGI